MGVKQSILRQWSKNVSYRSYFLKFTVETSNLTWDKCQSELNSLGTSDERARLWLVPFDIMIMLLRAVILICQATQPSAQITPPPPIRLWHEWHDSVFWMTQRMLYHVPPTYLDRMARPYSACSYIITVSLASVTGSMFEGKKGKKQCFYLKLTKFCFTW